MLLFWFFSSFVSNRYWHSNIVFIFLTNYYFSIPSVRFVQNFENHGGQMRDLISTGNMFISDNTCVIQHDRISLDLISDHNFALTQNPLYLS